MSETSDKLNHAFYTDKIEEQQSTIDELREENKKFRIMLCLSASSLPYTDDGELQDNSERPCIDYKRDSADEIRNKRAERVVKALAKLKDK